jgi:AraC-like DNA-binding protein
MSDPPGYFADRPSIADAASDRIEFERDLDLLSQLLDGVHLRGERIVEYAPQAPFTVEFTTTGTLHIIEQGELHLTFDGDRNVARVGRGDVVLLPRGDRHGIGSVQGPARWLCGTFTIGDPHASHLLTSLPSVITLRGARDQALEWLEVSRRMLLLEMQSPSQGSAVMIARILDLLFIQILRAWAADDGAAPGWLTGALDAQIGAALAAIHADPAEHWTVEGLAAACNLSRSAFAERFATRVGMPPATYLAHVRLHAAAELLRGTPEPVSAVAAKVGYTSEAAFSRAFRKYYGTPPARWRRRARGEQRRSN